MVCERMQSNNRIFLMKRYMKNMKSFRSRLSGFLQGWSEYWGKTAVSNKMYKNYIATLRFNVKKV